MYEFRPISDRIARMRDKVRDRLMIADSEVDRLHYEATELYRNYPPVVKKAAVSLYVISNMPINIGDDEYFVGDMGGKYWGAARGMFWLSCDIENTWPIGEDGLHHAPLDDPYYAKQKMAIHPDDLKELRALANKMRSKHEGPAPDWMPDGAEEVTKLLATTFGREDFWGLLLNPGHLTPGFQNIIRDGYGKIRKQAQDWMDARKGNIQGDDMDKYLFYKAATLACDGAITLTRRYAALAREKAESASPERKAELLKMAEGLDWIATEPARTFWEACQQTMIYNVFLKVDNDPGVTSMGRFDMYTWPFLKSDLEKGTITLDYAQELVDAFFLKLNLFYGGGLGKRAQTTGVGNTYQHTTIGGCDPITGEDGTNPVSFMVLETITRLKLHDPTISLRVSKNTPAEMWECALETTKRIGGLPLFQNEEIIIPGVMRELGFSLEDARDFSIIGCQEIVGSGTDYPAPNGMSMGHNGMYWPIVLDMAINNGINPMNGQQAPAEYCSGYLQDMKSFDELKAAFEKLGKWILDWSATVNNYSCHEQPRLFPFPNLSISTAGCMEKGKDVSAGGARYNSYGGVATGLATVADSLTALKYLVFDKKLVDAKTYLDAILADWVGYEDLQQMIINQVPHYGNGDKYADEQMTYLMDFYYNTSRPYSTARCKVYKCGMFGAADHVQQGEMTWATPDGRKAYTPIADACSPVQGRDVTGPTGVFTSSVCFDHSRYMDGLAVNLKIHPTALRGSAGNEKLKNLTQTYFDLGGMECQYNVVDSATMRKAQECPDEYHNLVVRIAGYSAYFVDMTEAMQNDVIARAEHSL
ncbi:MAG: hypothetical protein MJ067_02040 [Oscillospiraceae bacterium]|nr:hypothetical protein [Oscillospiraceae bacterium]